MKIFNTPKIRLLVLLLLGFAFLYFGSIFLSYTQSSSSSQLSEIDSINNLEQQTAELLKDEPTFLTPTRTLKSNNKDQLSQSESKVAGEDVIAQAQPTISPPPQTTGDPQIPSESCEPMKEYCDPPGANLLDDVDFSQSHDGSFENPICTLNTDGSIGGKGCPLTNDQATHYQADVSILIPIRSRVFFNEGGNFARPEYIRQEVAGSQQCEEKLTSHGNNSFKIFSRGGTGLDGGICIPMKAYSGSAEAGINFRVSQQTPNISDNVDVTFRLGYTSSSMNNDFFGSGSPSLTEGGVNWVTAETISNEDYGGEEGLANRYTGGSLNGTLPPGATGLCFMAESAGGNGINTFWDGAYASSTAGACEDPLNHSDGIDRSCGGYACEGTEPQIKGNFYTDFEQEYYAYDMPSHWDARQCEYETESNGADSPYGTLFVGLDLNSCDINYPIANQRNLHPELGEDDICVGIGDSPADRNWTFGYAWIGGIKDFALLQYLDCAVSEVTGNVALGEAKKGTDANSFFCDRLIDSYLNSNDTPVASGDPNFYIRFQNTYSGLVNAQQAEGTQNFFKVPLLGSAVSSGILNNWQREVLQLDPFLIQKRNSGNGFNNEQKFNLEDQIISRFLRYEEHLYDKSTISKSEVLAEDLLSKGPVCNEIFGEPISKFHYGIEGEASDRAVFGFADDEGSFEHILHAATEEMTPEQVCDSQFIAPDPFGEVVGAECTILNIGSGGKDVTFTEDNIGNTLEQEGFVGRIAAPTLLPPSPTGVPDPDFETCPEVSLCGQNFGCGATMRDLYNACRANRPDNNFDSIGGNPFIRWERPEGWNNLEISGLNKVMEATWENEFTHYNQVIRHENVGIDVNQVVSVYDQQQPKCSIMPDDRLPVYCQEGGVREDPAKSKGEQVCRRVDPYNCDCGPGNFSTCLLDCPTNFIAPPSLPTIGLPIEGGPEDSIRGILENDQNTFLEKFIALLKERSHSGEGALNHVSGEVYNYEPRYTGGFRLANISDEGNTDQCADDDATGVSQVRIENYYAYAGQIPRMNERIAFAATNNKDPKTLDQLIFNPNASTGSISNFILRGGESYEYIALPYCDLLTEEEKISCNSDTDQSCDCLIRSCEQRRTDQYSLMDKYLPTICENMEPNPVIPTIPEQCISYLKDSWGIIVEDEYATCKALPKTNLNYNCDPMASYLISQGFDTPQLRLAACEDIDNINECRYDKGGVHLITGPTQEANYNRAEEIGLKWKMEVITEDTPDMINAMATSVDTFNGNTVFRWCNADQGDKQDQSCQFRTELTGSSAASGVKVAQMALNVARKTSKAFYISPVNEPVSEHWMSDQWNGSNPTDNTNTMADVSEFYQALSDELNKDQAMKSKITIGGPTYNVTAFGNYNNFENFHTNFAAKDTVDYWTINIYNHDDLPAGFNTIEAQFEKAKQVLADSKPIALNETGDFQHNIGRLATSMNRIGNDSRLKYALLFNAFGGWGDIRGQELILTDNEIRSVFGGIKDCPGDDLQCYVDPDTGGTLKPHPLPFGYNFTGIYDDLLDVGTPGGRSCGERPPAAGEYYEQDDIGMACPAYGERSQLPEYNFYRGALRTCSIPPEQTHWTEENTYNKGGDIDDIYDEIISRNIVYNGVSLNNSDPDKLKAILTRSKAEDRNPMIVIAIWGTESAFGQYGNSNEFGCGSSSNFDESLDCILRIGYMVDTPLDEMIDRYGPFCDTETYATGDGGGGGELICPEGGATSPECFVSPMNEPIIVSQCFGSTVKVDSSNSFCFDSFNLDPNKYLSGYDYVLGKFHAGIDLIPNPTNDKNIYASALGEVHSAGPAGNFGNLVEIEHKIAGSSTVYYTRYAHLESIAVSVGQQVDHNTLVGIMGNSGRSDFTHLHFEILAFPNEQSTVPTTMAALRDPTEVVLRDRKVTPPACAEPTEVVNEVASGEGVTRYNLDGLVVLKIDKDQYDPKFRWNNSGKTLASWAQGTDEIYVNSSIFEPGPPYESSGRLKIEGNIIKSNRSQGFDGRSGYGYLSFNSGQFRIDEADKVTLGSFENMLESLPILIFNGTKYTSNTSYNRRSTSVGFDRDGNYFIVISPVDGEHSYSRIADLMLASGFDIQSLIGLDGGGSSGLIVKGEGIAFNNSTSRFLPGVISFNKK